MNSYKDILLSEYIKSIAIHLMSSGRRCLILSKSFSVDTVDLVRDLGR